MESLPLDKAYELVVNYKTNLEKNRDEINKYYISLFSLTISVMPFIHKVVPDSVAQEKQYKLLILLMLSLLGMILSVSWKLTLENIHLYTKGIDKFLMQIEGNSGFIHFMNEFLTENNSPARVTKQEMLIPRAFSGIFALVAICVGCELFIKLV